MSDSSIDSIPQILGWSDLMGGQPDVDWLIDEVLPLGSRAMLYADSGMGKSFTVLDMALHIATGKKWQGRTVKQGPVYYLAAENHDTLHGRMMAWEAEHKGAAYWERHHRQTNEAEPPFYVIPVPVDLSSPGSVDTLLSRLGSARLIVIDTLLTSMGDGDIKDTSDSYRALGQVNRIIRHTGATVLLVHHEPNAGKSPLGGSAWRGGVQVRMRLTRQRNRVEKKESMDFQDGDTITLTCEKLTHAAFFAPIKLAVRLALVKRGLRVPVLAAKMGSRRRRVTTARVTSTTPKKTRPGVDFQRAYEEFGDDRTKLQEITGLSNDALRKRISRLKQAQCDAA